MTVTLTDAANDNDATIVLHPAKIWLLALEAQGVETFLTRETNK